MTSRTLEQRWQEHCKDINRVEIEKRPLYSAMKKYGIEHFHMKKIEECSIEDMSEREKYWIEYYGTFKNGYNATIGGDGRPYIDYDLVVATYKELQNQKETAEKLNISVDTVHIALVAFNEYIYPSNIVSQQKMGKIVNQYDLNGNFIQSFPSAKSAAESLNKITSTSRGASSHITDVCKGKRKTAYGYKWKFAG